ncbi:flagellar basal body rod protein FlgC [Candidatus Epulonipiscium viviparus]|uniref:flagellar basal body rod protein FlgC n=1 Tax=Candidatus Epulonipiscium viviparus TaxID=420336 RepID=UPI00016C0A09|nr:flagellar basal body rod protein FlgC [Candidatus Epulopiscium viviparus]
MSFFSGMDIAATGLTAQRFRLDVITQNLANINSTRTPDGGPYQRRTVLFESIPMRDAANKLPDNFHNILNRNLNMYHTSGVQVSGIVEDDTPFPLIFDPTHPDANEEGYVEMPNVDVVTEMVNMISASRSYEANVTAFNNLKSMNTKALDLGR